MKNKFLRLFILLEVFGASLLSAACMFAPVAYAAPTTAPNSVGSSMGPTIMEWVYGLPAVVFAFAAVVAIVGGAAMACASIFHEEK